MKNIKYLMESDEEALRLDIKTDSKSVRKQALWAGIKPGMRVLDVCCGPGKTSSILHKLVEPRGTVVGVDFSDNRIRYARKHYSNKGIQFRIRNILDHLDDLGKFDFIWIRFVLEYYCSESLAIVRNISKILKPGGVICLIDLDHNCLSHYGLSRRLEKTLFSLMKFLESKADFDPYAGRKLYSYLYRLGYEKIDVFVTAHHLIYGEIKDTDWINWKRKIQIAPGRVRYPFQEYKGGYKEFNEEFDQFFSDPARFTYTPIISCRGQKPEE
ncbi:MAG: methyltransferase domain-containing protein [bacterium]|nr:methyltransferase domain-containing protein [bacterium]